MSPPEWWLYTKLNKILKLGYLSVMVTFDGGYWTVSVLSRGDVKVLASETRLRRALRKATEA